MSLTASVAILFVLLLRLLLKKAPKVISYALWGVVLFRLLCPVSIESGLSLFGLLDTPTVGTSERTSTVEYIPTNIVHTEFPDVVLPMPGIGEAITEALPQGEEQLAADPLEASMSIATYVWLGGIHPLRQGYGDELRRGCGAQARPGDTGRLQCVPFSLATGKRIIAGMPLAFGEGNTKSRIKNLANWKKPAFWVVLVAVIACIVLAVCLLTNPTGYHADFTDNEIVSASCLDFRSGNDEASSTELNQSQIDELMSRLKDVKQARKSNKYAGFTPGYQISAKLQDETYIRISGYSFDIVDMVDIEHGERRYVVTDKEFCEYLSRICAGGDVTDAAVSAIKWFDYLAAPSEMQWDGRLEINLPEFPDVTFRWYPERMEAVVGGEIIPLYSGMPIWNAYFYDLTGDGLSELCSSLSMGSGIVDNRVMIYDYANGASYSLEDRGTFDYTLRQDENDGQLYVDKNAHWGGGFLSTGRLAFLNDAIQILGQDMPTDNIRDTIDPTDDANFAYDTAEEKFYEDENNEYFFGGIYSQYVIVHYTDGTQEDIVTALNAGRAAIADLDKFGIRYWAEPKAATETDPLYAAITSAILAQNKSNKPDGLLHCANFVLLKQEELCIDSEPPTPIQVTAYGIALHEAIVSPGTPSMG